VSASADVIVIGAGIVGAACADAIARGGLKVAVIESGAIGGGTTAACMGHIVVMDDSEAQFALTRYSSGLWHQLAAELPSEAEFTQAGTLWVASGEEEMAEARRKHAYYGKRGVDTEILDARALAEAEPNLRPGLAGALRVPRDSVVYPPWIARWLVERSGARVIHGEAVAASGTEVRLRDGTVCPAGAVVNATGVWAPRLTSSLQIQPRKGHLLITDRYPGFLRHQLVELGYLKSAHGHGSESVAMNLQPRATGQILIGSSRQLGVDSSEIEEHMLQRMLQRAMEYVPGLGQLRATRTWTGLRPCSPDNLPYIGPMPGDSSLLAAAGHEGLGITTSLATGTLIADLLLKRTPAIPAAPYFPARTHAASH